ncbi:MAG TPA: BMP family ABC transporter substrate-binding protein, partial [Actinomycetota bacterium]|nr:BMP family ABC transporter substrate-binding protein [Actinomycetota bacterium]
MNRRKPWLIVLLVVLSLFVAACAEEDEPTDAGGDGTEEVDFLACLVTDTGGVDDKSFNQAGWEGLQRAEEELGVEVQFLESQSPNDFQPNINAFIDQGCNL